MIRSGTLWGVVLSVAGLLPAADLSSASSPDSLIEAGHYKRARTLVDARLHVNPNDAYALFLESRIKQNLGNLPGAIASAERATALEPHNAAFHGQLAEVYAYTADESSWIRGIGYVHQMKREIATALSIEPKNTDTLLVSMMFAWKAPKLAGGDKKKARSVADEIVQNDPRWGYLAEARLLESNDDTRAESFLKKAVSIDPAHYRAIVELARFYCCVAGHKDYAAAETYAREALKLDAGRAGAYDVLARVYAAGRRWADLDAILAQAEKNVPDDLAPYYQAANILLKDDAPRATAYLRKYLGQEAEGREPTHRQAQALLELLTGR
jgi:tetratricopeptide (TPR) repeat protein